jgi:PAS domain S-box-containing protein
MENKTRTSDKKKGRIKYNDRYFNIVQSIPDAILLVRASDGIVLDVNGAFEKLTGYLHKEIFGQTYDQLPFFPKPGFRVQVLQELEAKGEIDEIETSIFRKDGSIANVIVSSRCIEVDGKLCHLNIIRDITGQKQVEDALRESEQRVRQKLDAILSPETDIGKLKLADIIDARMIQSLMNDFHKLTHIPMAIVDLQGKVLVGVGWQDICVKFHRIHPETCRHCVESDTQLSTGIGPGEFRLYKCKNNMWDIATPLIVGGHHVGNIFSGQFFFEEEPLNYELFRSQAMQYGFNEQSYIAALETVPFLSRESVDTGIVFLMKIAHMLSHLSYSNIKLVRSLAERDALMNSLQESEQRYRNLFDRVPIGIFRTTAEGRILDANPALVYILGYPDREALLATNAASIYVSPEDRRQWRVRAEKEKTIQGFETRMQRPDGGVIWVRISGRITHDEGKQTYYEGTMEDITEHKQAEEALQKAQEELIRNEKLSVLGRLAGIVGHELRNPLGVMNNAVYFLKTVMSDADETVKEYLDMIKQEIDNSERIIIDLLDFARTRTPQVASVTPGALVNKSLGKCHIPENISIKTDISDALPRVSVDPFQMNQVLQNLIANAVQAMPEGGVLSISARRESGVRSQESGSGSKLNTQHSKLDGDFVGISISDTGKGISPENMEKLFQPLFTTKTKGIGLGLVVCKNLVEANGGRIEVESKLGEGTTFKVLLPSLKNRDL